MNTLRHAALVATATLITWAPAVSAYNFFPHLGYGGWMGYTYEKWGPPALGTGATVYWSIMPAGTAGSAYCAPACMDGTNPKLSSLTLPNFYDWNTHTFHAVNLTDPEIIGYIRNALRTWSATTGVTFVYLPTDSGVAINDPAAEPPPLGATGQIRIGAFDLGDSGSAAAGYGPPPNGFEPDNVQFATGAGDLLINSNAVYAYQNPPGAEGSPLNSYPQGGGLFLNDFEGLILHEIGHTLGLDHSAVADAVMCGYTWWDQNLNSCTYYSPATYVINRQPSADDIAGIQTLYGPPVDTDGDGVPDAVDNCTLVANALPGNVPGTAPPVPKSQLDADNDGFGNRCDGDFNNTGAAANVNTTDYSILRSVMNKAYTFSTNAARSDLNGDGTVNTTDYSIFRNLINKLPGPSGLQP